MAGAADTAKLVAELSLDDKRFLAGAKRVAGATSGLQKGIGQIGTGAGKLSAGLARSGAIIGGAVVAGFAGATKAAIDWEDAFTGVLKTVDATPEALSAIGDELRAMSTRMPNTAVELAGIAEQAGAMGVKAKDITAFTEQVAILAATTDVSADDASVALGQMTTIIGLAGATAQDAKGEFDNFAATLVDLGNKGNSTEAQILEITRRSGGLGVGIGLAKDEVLAFSSAAANLGLGPELAGTALQKLYQQTSRLAASPKGLAALGELAGTTGKAFKQRLAKDTSGALTDLLRGLGKLPADQRVKAIDKLYGKGSGISRLIDGLSTSVDQNLVPALATSEQAWRDQTAAAEEFAKRNATVKSAIQRLRNTALDAAVTLGEGMAPAIGRAADKLSTFLAVPENRNFLKSIGEDIGKAIDGIDWQQVIAGGREFIDVLKVAFDYAKRIFDAVNALPTEVKGAAAGLIGLNKLSGGLIGEGLGGIVGGLGKVIATSIGSALPGGLGRAFVQPVFVTNFPVGFGAGGAAGAAGGAGKLAGAASALGKVFIVGEAIGLAVAVNEVRQQISDASTAQAAGLQQQTADFIAAQPSKDALQNALGGVEKGIHDLEFNPLHVLVQGEALDKLRAMRDSLKTQLADRTTTTDVEKQKGGVFGPGGLGKSITDAQADAATKITTEVETMRGKIADDLATVRGGADLADLKGATTTAGSDTSAAARNAGVAAANASRSAGSGVEAAIRANRPVTYVDVNIAPGGVQSAYDVSTRYGPAGGDRGLDRPSGVGPGG